jgi:hypothetical protein
MFVPENALAVRLQTFFKGARMQLSCIPIVNVIVKL